MYLNRERQIDSSKISLVNLPYGDKSMTHRALICAFLSDGKCVIKNPAINADTLATVDCLIKLGATVKIVDTNIIEVSPPKNINTDVVFDCKNSGTTARLLAGVVSGLNIHVTFVGDQSLSKRPMDRIITPLRLMGAKIEKKEGCLFEIFPSNGLKAIDYTLPISSAQVKSSILYAGLFAQGITCVREPIATRNHTEIFLNNFGADISYGEGWATISNVKSLKAIDCEIPNDFSTAAFLLALKIREGVILQNVGLNPTRIGFLEWLKSFGVTVETRVTKYCSGEPTGDIMIKPSCFKATNASASLCTQMIDEIPICCLLSALANGDSKFDGLGELAYKESNRIEQIKKLLSSFDVQTVDIQNGLIVKGKGKLSIGSAPNTFDHRISMLGVVASILAGRYFPPKNPECIDVSCPRFLQLLGFEFKCALFGENVRNSLSPKLYECFKTVSGIKIDYDIYDLSPQEFESDFFEKFKLLNGANLTIPYKTKLTDEFKPLNTLFRIGDGFVGFNTDGYGLLGALKEKAIDLCGKTVLILGCGGSAQAVARELVAIGAKVCIRNRTPLKVEKFSDFCALFNEKDIETFFAIMSFLPPTNDLVMVDREELSSANFVFDACYTTETCFTKTAKECCSKVISGKSMLFWQGVKNFEIWTGINLTNAQIKQAQKLFYGDI